ncbi:SLATT domain-containing protein [Candidatus Riflebacteria bacterium]
MNEQNTPETRENDSHYEFLIAEIRQLYARVIFFHKIHIKHADKIFAKEREFSLFKVLLCAATTVFLFLVIFGWYSEDLRIFHSSRAAFFFAMWFSIIVTFMSVYQREFNPGKKSLTHRITAFELLLFKENLLLLLTSLEIKDISIKTGLNRRRRLQGQFLEIYRSAPRIESDDTLHGLSDLLLFMER